MTDLLADISEALGSSYVEQHGELQRSISLGTGFSPPIDHHREVLGGAKDPASGRVAWMELRSAPPIDGYVPVEIDVRFAWGGELRHVVVPYTYNPYFGARVGFARWYGERFVIVYREKHRMLLSHFDPPYEHQEYVQISDDCIVDGDRVFYIKAGELCGYELPAMTPTPPIAVPAFDYHQTLLLVRPGVAGIANLPVYDHDTREAYEADVAKARAAATELELP